MTADLDSYFRSHLSFLGIGDLGLAIWDWRFEIGDLGLAIWDWRFGIGDLGLAIWDWRFGIGDLGLAIDAAWR